MKGSLIILTVGKVFLVFFLVHLVYINLFLCKLELVRVILLRITVQSLNRE